jgi:hypothetical protein
MGYYEIKQKAAQEILKGCEKRPFMTQLEVDRLEAQAVAMFGLSRKAVKEIISANIEFGNLHIIKEHKKEERNPITQEEMHTVDNILKAKPKD